MSRRLSASLVGVLLLLLTSLVLPFLATPAAGYGEQVFEGNTEISGNREDVYASRSVAQSFLATETYRLLNLTLRVSNTGFVTDPLNVSIRADAGNRPASVSLASNEVVAGSAISLVSIPFPTPLVLTQGVRYWIVAMNTRTSGDAYRWYQSNGDSYPAGWAMVNVGFGWVNASPVRDMYFVTFGRVYDANVSVAMTSPAFYATPRDSLTFTIFYNNSGETPAPRVWINESLTSGLTYVSDTAVSSSTPFPNFTFDDVANGAHSFELTARVDLGVPPGIVLTNSATLVYANETWAIRPSLMAQASVVVAAQKQLYLVPGTPGPPHGLVPARPTGAPANTLVLSRGAAATTFDLRPPLARPFHARELTVVLFLDSYSGTVENLDVNLTLADWNGVSLVPLDWRTQRVTTNAFVDYQPFTFGFGIVNKTFLGGHRIRLMVANLASSSSSGRLAFNSTFADSRLELMTTTYVQIDSVGLQDATGPASLWSPRDSLVVLANVSDPFGGYEISGARINITAPGGVPVVTDAPMQLRQTDPSDPSAWKLFDYAIGPPLDEGTYSVEVVAIERNGVEDAVQAQALVRGPRFTLTKVATEVNVRSGDRFFYHLWFNNTGNGSAVQVWVNDTLPSEVNLLSSTPLGNQTGPDVRWTFSSVGPGSNLIVLEVEVLGGIENVTYISNRVTLNYTDEKGHAWPEVTSILDIVFQGPVVSIGFASDLQAIHSNETVAFSITLTNAGDPARNLWVNMTLPSGLMYVSDSAGFLGGSTVVVGNLVRTQLTSMPGPATWSYTVIARARAGLTFGAILSTRVDLNHTNLNDVLMKARTIWENLTVLSPSMASASIAIGVSSARPGDPVAAVLVLTNLGNEGGRDVWIDLALDPYLGFVNASAPATVSQNQVSFQLGTVSTGLTRVFLNVSVALAASDGQTMAVSGVLGYSDGFGNLFPLVMMPADSVVAAAPRVSLTVSPTSATIDAGARFSYLIRHTNAGSRMAGDVWLNLTLPASFVYVGDTADGERAALGTRYMWHWRNMPPGENAFILDLAARTTVPDGSSAELAFETAYTDERGVLRGELSALARVDFVAPVLWLSHTANAEELLPGALLTYVVTVRNVGGGTAKTVWMLDSVDDRFEIVSYTSRVRAEGAPNLNWTFSDFAPGREEVIELRVRVRDGVASGSLISNALEAVFTNSDGAVLGYARSVPLVIRVAADAMPVFYILAIGSAAGTVAVLAIRRRKRPQIEDVFLVYRDGVLMHHLSRSLVEDKDGDVLSGMLTAVQEFVRDAFRYEEHRELHRLDFGNYRMLIERGRNVYLAVVYSGQESGALRRNVRKVLDSIESAYGPVLATWNGNMEQVIGAKELIREHLLRPSRRPARLPSRSA